MMSLFKEIGKSKMLTIRQKKGDYLKAVALF